MKRDPIRTLLQSASIPRSEAAMLRTTQLAVGRISQPIGAPRPRAGRPTGRRGWPALPRLSPAWRAGVLASVGLLTALSFTPPGRAATGWVGGLVGIGEVGGPPSVQARFGDSAAFPDQVVIATGTASGDAYELSTFDAGSRWGTCFELNFPDLPREHGAVRCISDQPLGGGVNGFSVAANDGDGASNYHPNDGTWTTPALGIISSDVAGVRVTYDVQGAQRVVELEIASLPKSVRKKGAGSAALQAAFFFLPQYVANADSATVTTYDSQGNEIGQSSEPDLLNLARCQRGLDCPNK